MFFLMEMTEEIIKTWLGRINEWTSLGVTGKCILEMTDAVEELKYFLTQLKEVLTQLEPRDILSQFPSVPKFLHNLLDNVLVQTTEDLHRLVLHCVTAVAVSSQQHKDEVNEKSIKWVKSQIKTVCSSHSAIVSSFTSLAEQVGLQPVEVTEQFNKELVNSLVHDLCNAECREWSNFHREFIPRYPIKGSTLRNISEMCLPVVTKPVVYPLVEALLSCEAATDVFTKSNLTSADVITAEQALSPHFLNLLKDNPREYYSGSLQGKLALSYTGRVSLWMKIDEFLEEEIMCLLEICCFERKYMSRKEMKKMASLRELPRALSENISLFSIGFEIIQRILYETNGNHYVIRFTGVLLQLLSDVQRQKNKTPLADTFIVNYASLWSTRLASFVNLLTVDWTDMPANSFLHHAKSVEDSIKEICGITSQGFHSYYIWLILQGFPDLLHGCYFVVLFSSDCQFVETCLTILLWCHGGGTELATFNKIKIRSCVDTLRRLRNKSQILTSDILCALDPIVEMTNSQPNVAFLIRHLVTQFMLISCSSENLDFHQIFAKLTGDLSVADAFTQLLDVVESTFLSDSQWHFAKYKTKIFSENGVKLLTAVHTRLDEFVSQDKYTQISTSDDDILGTHSARINDLHSRFELMRNLLPKETG